MVFGRDTATDGNFSAAIGLGSLAGSNGFRLDGEMVDGQSGFSVSSTGDINGDGVDDLIIGAYRAGPPGDCGGTGFTDTDCSGRSYVVFGGIAGPGEVPAIGLTPMEVDFGNIGVGQTSLPQTVTLENTGNGGDLILDTLGLSGANAGDFALQNDDCSDQTMVPMATCTFEISLSPSAAGARAAQVDIPSNAPTSPDTMGLNGTGIQGALAIAPDPVDFGPQIIGTTSASMSATLQNTGSADVNVDSVSAPVAPFNAAGGTCGNAPFAIAPGTSCTLDYTFSPTAVGLLNDFVIVTSDAVSGLDQFDLQGSGVQPASAVLDPVRLDFGNVEVFTPGAPLQITLTSDGPAPLVVDDVAVTGAAASDYLLLDDCTGLMLDPGDACTIEVTFEPQLTGTRLAELAVATNAPTSPDTAALVGSGIAPDGLFSDSFE